jgi:16S rRNA (guanine527-N7)-methyltransferase
MSSPGGERARLLLDRYLEELTRWGTRTNLVGSLERRALEVHVRDSLAAVPLLGRDATVVDLGSGAGFPGVPIAIARPDLRVTLLEIREKRVHFLRHVVRVLELDCAVVRGSIEAPPATPFDYALARAVAEPAELFPRARPWVSAAGEVWIWGRARAAELGIENASEVALEEGRGWIVRVPGPNEGSGSNAG